MYLVTFHHWYVLQTYSNLDLIFCQCQYQCQVYLYSTCKTTTDDQSALQNRLKEFKLTLKQKT